VFFAGRSFQQLYSPAILQSEGADVSMFWHLGGHQLGNDDLAAAKGLSNAMVGYGLRRETLTDTSVHKVEKVEAKYGR
jgi:hypothetical protein